MFPSEWAGARIESLVNHSKLVWVEDPYCLLDAQERQRISHRISLTGSLVIKAGDAWSLRKALLGRDPETTRLVVIDQSYRLRNPRLAPTDAKPKDLVPLKAPDWKPFVSSEEVFRPTVRDFLIYVTEDNGWPSEVNIFPYEELARTVPQAFVESFQSYRSSGRSVTGDDLIVIGASAALGIDLVGLNDPVLALELAFHSEEKWKELGGYFNASELEKIRGRLRSLPSPIGQLFGPDSETARQAVVALLVLSQHTDVPGLDRPGLHLPVLSGAFSSFVDCDAITVTEPPSWLVTDEVPRFEALLTPSVLRYLSLKLGLDRPENARVFWEGEKLSSKLRQLAAYEGIPQKRTSTTTEDDFSIAILVPQFRDRMQVLEKIVRQGRCLLDRVKLTPLRQITSKQLLDIFDGHEVFRIDGLIGALNRIISDVEGPARSQWVDMQGFQLRWQKDVEACRDLMASAGRLRDDLDHEFGKLLESKYTEVVPGQCLTTGMMYERFIAQRRRTPSGQLLKALILVVDSMRLDIWRQLIKPALERDYTIEETLGFAELPSETVISRACFFAGKSPAELIPGVKESSNFERLVSTVHGKNTSFTEASNKRAGMRYCVKSSDGLTWTGVFDFPDVLSHQADWDRHIMDATFQPFIREIRALLHELGPDTLVFITADHGHYRREGGSPVFLDGVTDVGYRSALVPTRVEGSQSKHVFQIPASTIRHKTGGYYVFPKPGFHLRSRVAHVGTGRSDASYRHGGISMAEVVVPLACLKHRKAKTRFHLSVNLYDSAIANSATNLQVTVSADGTVSSPVRLASNGVDVEPMMIPGASSNPETFILRYVPTSPGRHRFAVQAWLGDALVGETPCEVEVEPAPVPEDEAKTKLKKLWGND